MLGKLKTLSIQLSLASKVWLLLCVWVTFGLSATRTWTGGGADNNWSTTSNWGGTAPVAGDDIVFAGSTRLTPNNDITPGTTFASISISSGAGAFSISGNSILLSGGGAALSNSVTGSTITISNDITFVTVDPTISNTSGGSLILSGAISLSSFSTTITSAGNTQVNGMISGWIEITKMGNGELLLGGTNSFGGAINISAGVLKVNNSSALQSYGPGTTISAGAALDLNGMTCSPALPITINGTGISNGGAIFNSSATGATFAGLITLGSASSIIATSGPIQITNTGSITGSFGLTLGGAYDGNITSCVNTGSASVTKQDGGTWTLSGSNVYS